MSIASLNLDNTVGCFFITGILTSALWAASTIQVYTYYEKHCKNDTLTMKIHVALAWILDTTYQAVILRTLYRGFVSHYGNIISLLRVEKNTFSLIPIVSAFLTSVVQALFVMRIWHLSRHSKFLTGISTIFVLCQFAIITVYFAKVYPLTDYMQLQSVANFGRAMSGTIAVVDTAIGVIIIFLLGRNRSGYKRTDTAINRLILYTIATGLLTAVDAVIALITSLALPNTFVNFIFEGIGPTLYLISMLFLLNSRRTVRNVLDVQTAADATSLRTSVLRVQYRDTTQDAPRTTLAFASNADIETGSSPSFGGKKDCN